MFEKSNNMRAENEVTAQVTFDEIYRDLMETTALVGILHKVLNLREEEPDEHMQAAVIEQRLHSIFHRLDTLNLQIQKHP